MRRQRERQRRITHADYLEIQRRLSEGETFEVVGAAVGCSTKTIQRFMLRVGGLLARSQGRSPLRLSVAEREEVSRGLRAGDSLRQIARRVGRVASTVSREVSRNGRRAGSRAWRAEETAARRARRPKPGKLLLLPRLRRAVRRRLLERWSPEQIAASLPSEYPDDSEMRVSHETIYRSLFVQARGGLRKELAACLRSGRTRRRPRRRTQLSRSGRLKDMVLISERPAEAADRAVPGHWEGDLIIGKGSHSAIGTLVERSSRYVMLVRLPNGRTAEDVRIALTRQISKLPKELRRSLTWDQGKEMAEHVRFSIDSKIDVYFCDPHSPWQRGSNENTNGLLRQYFPRTEDLTAYSQAQLNAVARQLNGRPRQTLGWMKPSQVFARFVALTT
jgi:IS30 family transposase